jgi:hypothetical protein
MTEYIEIKFLSPVSNYIFTKDDIIYVLVVTTTDSFGEIHINKIIVKEINNIDNFIRAYAVKKSIKVLPSLFGSYLNIKLFSRDIIENRIILLFSGQIQTDKYEYGNKSYIKMNKSPFVDNKPRSSKYYDDSSFIEEQYFNYNNSKTDEYCLLFFTKTNNPIQTIVKPTIIKYTRICS